jgi:hypothetical protein
MRLPLGEYGFISIKSVPIHHQLFCEPGESLENRRRIHRGEHCFPREGLHLDNLDKRQLNNRPPLGGFAIDKA